MSIPTLQTSRLLLHPWAFEDAPALFQILQEPDIFKYFPRTAPPRREWVDKYIAHHFAHWQERGYGHWAVVTKNDGQVAGWTGLEYLPELDQTEVAYLLSKQVRGRGYATEAARAAIAFGFGTCHLPVIIGLVHPENVASVRVLEKCGLTFTDRLTLWELEMLRYSTRLKEK